MSSGLSVPVALAQFDRDVRDVVDAEPFGFVLPLSSIDVHYLTRHRAGAAAHRLPRNVPDASREIVHLESVRVPTQIM